MVRVVSLCVCVCVNEKKVKEIKKKRRVKFETHELHDDDDNGCGSVVMCLVELSMPYD